MGLSQFQMQALMQHLERLMKQRDDALHERLDQMENRNHNEEERRRRGICACEKGKCQKIKV